MTLNDQLFIMQRYRDHVRIQRRPLPIEGFNNELEWHDLARRGAMPDDHVFDFRHYEYRELPPDAQWWGVYDTQTEQLLAWCGSASSATGKALDLNLDAKDALRYKPVLVQISDVASR